MAFAAFAASKGLGALSAASRTTGVKRPRIMTHLFMHRPTEVGGLNHLRCSVESWLASNYPLMHSFLGVTGSVLGMGGQFEPRREDSIQHGFPLGEVDGQGAGFLAVYQHSFHGPIVRGGPAHHQFSARSGADMGDDRCRW